MSSRLAMHCFIAIQINRYNISETKNLPIVPLPRKKNPNNVLTRFCIRLLTTHIKSDWFYFKGKTWTLYLQVIRG